MSLPPSFAGMPVEEQHHHYRNICIALKKAIKAKESHAYLKEKMDLFLNASREVTWPHYHTDVYRKEETEKALQKVVNEFRRYIYALENNAPSANAEDLLTALAMVESLIDTLKVR